MKAKKWISSTECQESERGAEDISFLLLKCKYKLQNALLSVQIDQGNAQEDFQEGLCKYLYITPSQDLAAHRTAVMLRVTRKSDNNKNLCFIDEDCQAGQ